MGKERTTVPSLPGGRPPLAPLAPLAPQVPSPYGPDGVLPPEGLDRERMPVRGVEGGGHVFA